MNSVDFADYLSRKLNLPFRECYQILANAVKLSETDNQISNKALKTSLKELGYSSKILQDLKHLQNPKKTLEQRQHLGSPSPEQTVKQIIELSNVLDSLSKPIIDLEKKVLKAKKYCQNYKITL